jgi:hypothetical protein
MTLPVFRDEIQHVKFPKDIDDAKQLGLVLSRYKDKYFLQVPEKHLLSK